MTKHKYAEMAYNIYKKECNGKPLITGQLLPVWENLPISIRDAWYIAIESVINMYNKEFEDDLR
jgi:hypothetical protein